LPLANPSHCRADSGLSPYRTCAHRAHTDCHTILRMVRNDMGICRSLRLEYLPVPSSVTASPCHLPPREGRSAAKIDGAPSIKTVPRRDTACRVRMVQFYNIVKITGNGHGTPWPYKTYHVSNFRRTKYLPWGEGGAEGDG
jgi:hypothetical protein